MQPSFLALRDALAAADLAKLSDAAAAAKLNADPSGATVARALSFGEMAALVSRESYAKVFNHRRFADLKQAIDDGSVAATLELWLLGFSADGSLESTEVDALRAYATKSRPDGRSRAQAIVDWGVPVTANDVKRARAGED